MKKPELLYSKATNVSRETLGRVEAVLDMHKDRFAELTGLWLWWNKHVNLFSRGVSRQDLQNHIRHSLFLLCNSNSSDNTLTLDAGTGGGLPGLPMAIAAPARRFLLADKVKKKQFAVRDIIRKLGLKNVETHTGDIRTIRIRQPVLVVSKHAFHVKDLMEGISDYTWTEVQILKGKDLFSELDYLSQECYKFQIKQIHIPGNPFFHEKYMISIRHT